jgi:hypothetical protein
VLQAHSVAGYIVCYAVMLAIYYTNSWGAKSQPFMSTQLRSEDGSKYPIAKVFVGGVLDESALQKYGIPKLTGSFAYAMFMANAAVSIYASHTGHDSNCLTTILDWCPHCPLRSILGRRHQKSLQEFKKRTIRRPPPRTHGCKL